MFDNLKKMYELKKMQDEFKKEKLTVEKRGVTVSINGSFEVEEIKLNPELGIEDQQSALKEALNEARESIQKTLAQKMMSSGIGL
ncbi:MAG: YbaB/EbfC family DNA-binding protein [Candidatus Staskawiczbacteria bacterium]|nr:YbaB/EbfC family DNA-binding protein [Candidatus Staskawiczbacteria bacterium]